MSNIKQTGGGFETISPSHSDDSLFTTPAGSPSREQIGAASKASTLVKQTPIGPVTTSSGIPFEWTREKVEQMHTAIEAMAKDPEFQRQMDLIGITPAPVNGSGLGSMQSSAGFVAMDISYFLRTIPIYVKWEGLDTSHVLQSMGLTSFLSTFFASASLYGTWKGYQASGAVDDTKGKVFNLLWGIANVGQLAGGVGLGGARTFSVIAMGTHQAISKTSTSLIGRIAWWMSTIGIYGIELFYFAMAIAFYFRARWKAQFQTKIKKCETIDDKIAFFKKRLTGDSIQFEKKLRYEKTLNETSSCFKRALLRLKYKFNSFRENGTWSALTDDERKKGYIAFAKEHMVTLVNKEVKEKKAKVREAVESWSAGKDEQLAVMGETLVKVRSLQKKEMKLQDMLGGRDFARVKKLYGRLQTAENAGRTDLDEIKGKFLKATDKVKDGVNRTKWLERILVIGSIVGLIFLAFALANPVSGGVAVLITIGTLIGAAVFMVVDGVYLHRAKKSRATGKFDYLMFAINVILIAASLALSFAFVTSGWALGLAVVIGAFWLGMSCFSVFHTYRNKRFNAMVAKVVNGGTLTEKEKKGLNDRGEESEFNKAVENTRTSGIIGAVEAARRDQAAARTQQMIEEMGLTSKKVAKKAGYDEVPPALTDRNWNADLMASLNCA